MARIPFPGQWVDGTENAQTEHVLNFQRSKKNPSISPFFLHKTLRKCRIDGSTPNWSLAATKTWFLVKKHKKERVDGSTAKRYLGSIKISTYERKTGKPNRWLNFPETISVWGSWPRAGAGVLKIEKCFGEYSICSRFVLVDLQYMLPVQKSSGGLATLFGDCAIYSCILRVWLGLQVLLKLAIFHLGLSFNKWPGDPFLMRRRANFYIKKFQTKWKFGTSSNLGLPSLNRIWARCWVLKFVII